MITTERLVLREYTEADWPAMHEYSSDPEVVKYTLWGPNTEEETRSFLWLCRLYQETKPRLNYGLAVTLKDSDRLIGGCGLYDLNLEHREGELGYCFNRNYWGQGFATEAGRAMLEFGLRHLGLHRIFATCDPNNTASRRVLEKIGMQQEGHLHQHRWAKGRWRDSLLFAILDSSWDSPTDEGGPLFGRYSL